MERCIFRLPMVETILLKASHPFLQERSLLAKAILRTPSPASLAPTGIAFLSGELLAWQSNTAI
ncbi:hypothetical protein BOO94_22685 [Pseudomonas sp. FSL W5-0299]|nr:hypothetical protein BOO94_22685 [Pseudomonas sp. FSL W5-0299]